MNAVSDLLNSDVENKTSSANFSAVIVYEDDVTYENAEPLYRRLLNDFSHDTNFHCQFVHFQALQIPGIAADVAAHAALADLVVFSCHARREFPKDVATWIESWLPDKCLNDSALAALVGISGESSTEAQAIRDYLHSVADRGHMQFLPNELSGSQTNPIDALLSEPPTAENVRGVIREQRRFRHWGINE